MAEADDSLPDVERVWSSSYCWKGCSFGDPFLDLVLPKIQIIFPPKGDNHLFNFFPCSSKTRRRKKSTQDLRRKILSGRRLLNFRENLRLSCWRPGMRLLIWDRWWISRIHATKNYIHNQVESVLGNDKTTKEQLGDEERKKFKWLYSQVEYHHLQK